VARPRFRGRAARRGRFAVKRFAHDADSALRIR